MQNEFQSMAVSAAHLTPVIEMDDESVDGSSTRIEEQTESAHSVNTTPEVSESRSSVGVDVIIEEDEESDVSEDEVPNEPPTIPEEDYDTDLEIDDDKWLHAERYDHDTSGTRSYMRVCEQLGVTPVSYFIKTIQNKELVMRHHGLGPHGAKAIAVPLENNASIEKIDLKGNSIEAEGAGYLTKVLKDNVYISKLVLSENILKTEGAISVCAMLMENQTISHIDLSGNEIDDKAADSLLQMFTKNVTLKEAYLNHNLFSDGSAEHFGQILALNDTLHVLDISWNHFGTRASMIISQGVQENVGLRKLNMEMNGLGLEGARAMGIALKVNRSLQEINISYTRIPLEGAGYIAVGLQTNDILRFMKVGSNPFGAEGAFVVLTGVDQNDSSSLEYIQFANILVTSEFETLQKKLECHREMIIVHGGLLRDQLQERGPPYDPMEAFLRDPMTKLKEYVNKAGYRLIDLLRQFDTDNSMTISRDEFISGIKKAGVKLTETQVDVLMERLDKDGNGEIDYRELVYGDNEHRGQRRSVLKQAAELKAESPQGRSQNESIVYKFLQNNLTVPA